MQKCWKCDNKNGQVKVPLDEKKFDDYWERHDHSGLPPEKVREDALEYAGYKWEVCSTCKGTGFIE
ncbi:hypothetical protein GKD14_16325 [Paeniclostridium sordellii]|nr:hypothetical protein [Paeniclostridium sordellii]MSB60508.1 hypothetical protein [Paeniclostridium sordellii]